MDGKALQRVPPVRSDCERDFREKFGRRMTERERDFLHLGNAVLDSIEEDEPEIRISETLIGRAWQTSQNSGKAVRRAMRVCEEAKALIATTRTLIRQLRNRGSARSRTHKAA